MYIAHSGSRIALFLVIAILLSSTQAMEISGLRKKTSTGSLKEESAEDFLLSLGRQEPKLSQSRNRIRHSVKQHRRTESQDMESSMTMEKTEVIALLDDTIRPYQQALTFLLTRLLACMIPFSRSMVYEGQCVHLLDLHIRHLITQEVAPLPKRPPMPHSSSSGSSVDRVGRFANSFLARVSFSSPSSSPLPSPQPEDTLEGGLAALTFSMRGRSHSKASWTSDYFSRKNYPSAEEILHDLHSNVHSKGLGASLSTFFGASFIQEPLSSFSSSHSSSHPSSSHSSSSYSSSYSSSSSNEEGSSFFGKSISYFIPSYRRPSLSSSLTQASPPKAFVDHPHWNTLKEDMKRALNTVEMHELFKNFMKILTNVKKIPAQRDKLISAAWILVAASKLAQSSGEKMLSKLPNYGRSLAIPHFEKGFKDLEEKMIDFINEAKSGNCWRTMFDPPPL
ncbi:MAG: hypothetical protein DHS80DRAFT_22522 [Piptocephalis tieghemiana]|nr:MAG: hypothetical protein DHS80DRAFT_22522 [Piptocephalis tieghemiana]